MRGGWREGILTLVVIGLGGESIREIHVFFVLLGWKSCPLIKSKPMQANLHATCR